MMNIPPGLDPDLLRSFVLVAEGGSVTRAALRVGRTQSAVSMQMRRLEEALGQPLLLRGPRGLSPTAHGLWLLDRARRLLTMHDEIVNNFRMPEILAGFAEAHPAAEVEVVCLPSTELLRYFDKGDLDLTLFSGGNEQPGLPAESMWRGPLRWVGPAARPTHLLRPLPLVLCHTGCIWRIAATRALERAGVPWRMAYSSASQTGTHAVVLAGLGITVGLSMALPPGLRLLGQEEGMPDLPELEIAMVRHPGAAAEALAEHIRRGFLARPGVNARAA